MSCLPIGFEAPISSTRPALVPLTIPDAIEAIFGTANPDDLIGICSDRPGKLRGKRGESYKHSYFPLRVEDRYEFELIIEATEALQHKAAYTLLTTFRPDACRSFPVWSGNELSFSYRQEYISQLTGLFLDIDCGRSPEEDDDPRAWMTAAEAEEHVLDLVECEVIPQPSLMARSGRGVYVFYLVKEPLDVTDDVPFVWLGIVNRLLRRMQTLRMDEAASRTLNRLFKAPGTLGGRVIYSMLDDGTDQMRRYTLDEIEEFLITNADERDPEPQPEPQLIPYVPLFERSQRRKGHGERHWTQTARPMLQRVDEMKRLNTVRGGRWTNSRHNFLLYYATAQRVIGYAKFGGRREGTRLVKEIALRRTLRMNATLSDPLPKHEVEEMFRTMPKKPQRSETVSVNLGVTMNDVLAAGLKQLVPVEVMKRQAEMKIEQQNAKKRSEAFLDHLVLNGAPVTCIVKLTGKSRATVSRYIAAVADSGVELLPRTSLRGR